MLNEIIRTVEPFQGQLPNLLPRFKEAAAISPSARLAWAKEQRSYIYRDGWFLNTPVGKAGAAETLREHVLHLQALVDRFFPKEHRARAKQFAECHDDQEVVVHARIDGVMRDLNRFNKTHYKIPDAVKERLEELAIRLLLEGYPDKLAVWKDYQEGTSEASRMLASLDSVCVMWKCIEYVRSGQFKFEDFSDYWNYWTPQKAAESLHPVVSQNYIREGWSQIQEWQKQMPIPP